MREKLQQRLSAIVRAVLDAAGDTGELPAYALEPPKREEHGDFACNAAMLLAKRLRRPPREIADELVTALGADELVDRAEVAGPGFVNVWLRGEHWHDLLRRVLDEGTRYGTHPGGANERARRRFA